MMAAVLAVVFAAGCMSAPEKESSNQSQDAARESTGAVRYVEMSMIDGTRVGGKYVSESAAFTNIVPMYVIDKNGIMSRGSGTETGVTTSLIATVVTIEDPSSYVDKTLNEQAAAEKAYREERAAQDAALAAENARKMSQHS
jgi:hypothetical protein